MWFIVVVIMPLLSVMTKSELKTTGAPAIGVASMVSTNDTRLAGIVGVEVGVTVGV